MPSGPYVPISHPKPKGVNHAYVPWLTHVETCWFTRNPQYRWDGNDLFVVILEPCGRRELCLNSMILFGNLWKLEILFPRFALSSLSSAPTLDLHRRGSLSCSAREAAASRIESYHYATQLNTAERWWRHCRTVLNTQTPIIAFIMLSFQVLVCNMFVMPGTCVCFSAFRFSICWVCSRLLTISVSARELLRTVAGTQPWF